MTLNLNFIKGMVMKITKTKIQEIIAEVTEAAVEVRGEIGVAVGEVEFKDLTWKIKTKITVAIETNPGKINSEMSVSFNRLLLANNIKFIIFTYFSFRKTIQWR